MFDFISLVRFILEKIRSLNELFKIAILIKTTKRTTPIVNFTTALLRSTAFFIWTFFVTKCDRALVSFVVIRLWIVAYLYLVVFI